MGEKLVPDGWINFRALYDPRSNFLRSFFASNRVEKITRVISILEGKGFVEDFLFLLVDKNKWHSELKRILQASLLKFV